MRVFQYTKVNNCHTEINIDKILCRWFNTNKMQDKTKNDFTFQDFLPEILEILSLQKDYSSVRTVPCHFKTMEFIDLNLSNLNFTKSSFENCIFNQCNMNNLLIEDDLAGKKRPMFNGCNFYLCDLSDFNRKISPYNLASSKIFNSCVFEGVNFRNSNLSYEDFSRSSLDDCVFSNSVMNSVAFRYSFLKKCCLNETEFFLTDFSLASLTRSDFFESNFDTTTFYKTKFICSVFKGSKIFNSDFNEAKMFHSQFENVNFIKNNFKGVKMTYCYFKGAVFENCFFENTIINLATCDFQNAKIGLSKDELSDPLEELSFLEKKGKITLSNGNDIFF